MTKFLSSSAIAAAIATMCVVAVVRADTETLPIVPDDKLTPGVVASQDVNTVCAQSSGTYSHEHRHTSQSLKNEVFHRYGIAKKGRDFEIDHRCPLALGCADVVENLWPQAGWQHPSYHDKDRLETYVWRAVCKDKTMTLQEGQDMFLAPTDWRDSYRKVLHQDPH